MKNIKYKFLLLFILFVFNPKAKAEMVYHPTKISEYTLTDFVKQENAIHLKYKKLTDKNSYSKKSPEKPEAGKFYRLPLLISSLGLILSGLLLIFLAFNTIGYLGFILGVIGLIMMVVWLIFYEGEKIIS